MTISAARSKYNFRCDRCGTRGELDAKPGITLTSPKGWCNITNTIAPGLNVKDINGDLCDKCTASLRQWMVILPN